MPQLDDVTPYQVARVYWLLPPKERNFGEVAKRLGLKPDKAVQNHLSRLARQWEDEGKVQHVVLQEPPDEVYFPLVPTLEDQVRRRYGIREVVVVDTSRLGPPDCDPNTDVAAWNEYDDTLHKALGAWGARVLTSLVRPDDIVGVGSGRGPFYTAEECKIPPVYTTPESTIPSKDYSPKEVVSLTGKLSAHYWGTGAGRLDRVRSLDADFVAGSLVTGLGVDHPPTCLNRSIVVNRSERNELARHRKKLSQVTIALIGIGALAAGHRLKHHQASDDLDRVKDDLIALNKFAEIIDAHALKVAEGQVRKRGPFPHWVGDVCNSLFVVDGPLGLHALSSNQRADLQALVEKLNARFVNTRPEDLEAICRRGAVVAVAGGGHKASAIAHVVRQKKPWITHLITDDITARYLSRLAIK